MDAKAPSLFTAILIVSAIIGAIVIFFILSIIRQQRKNLSLYRQSVLAEITAMEKERARIAADLHDELGPMLSAIKLKIGSFDLTDEEDLIQAAKTDEHIDTLLKKMREISYDLIPNTLIRKGLLVALQEFVDFVSKKDSLQISFSFQEPIDVPEQKAIHIYRIAQELINNTIRHSGANSLQIDLKQADGTLFLSTSDNGQGFDHTAVSKGNGGIGLRNMLSRTEIIGGEMFVESKKNVGTQYQFEIPL